MTYPSGMKIYNADGEAVPSAQVRFYGSGGDIDSYIDEELTTLHEPVVLADSLGTFPPIFFRDKPSFYEFSDAEGTRMFMHGGVK